MLKLLIRLEAEFLALCARLGKKPEEQLALLVTGYCHQVKAIDRLKAKAANEQEKARLTDVVTGKRA